MAKFQIQIVCVQVYLQSRSIVTIFSFGFLSDEFYASHAYETN